MAYATDASGHHPLQKLLIHPNTSQHFNDNREPGYDSLFQAIGYSNNKEIN